MIVFAYAIMNGICAHAENRMLEITSQTEHPSADCVIKKLNEKKDKARKEIGIGETVTLTLTFKGGKKLNGNTKVTWTKKGKGATLKGVGTSATLTADLIMENNKVTVTAEVDDYPPAEITFNIKKPTHLTGKKDKEYGAQKDLGFGITGTIIITVHPTSVSFANCGIIEKNGGTIIDPQTRPPFQVTDHDPGKQGNPPNLRNEFVDTVTLIMPFRTIAELNGPCKWTWQCNYEATNIKKNNLIDKTQQIFTITRTNHPRDPKKKNCSGTITKFGVTFSVNAVE